MKAFILFCLLISSLSGCTIDKVHIIDFWIKNSTQLDLEFKTFKKGSEAIVIVKNSNSNTIGNFDISEQVFPYQLIDSVYVKFSDNKILKYNKIDNCDSSKSFFCSTNTTCVEKMCTFEIDSIEYQKAK